MSDRKRCAVIGGGPAGLISAEVLSQAGCAVTVFERMPSLGRKFLMAGIGGLNLTHSEPSDRFAARYRGKLSLSSALEAFEPDDLRAWCEGLGQETFVGSSGRVFPTAFKASPLLRAWIARLDSDEVEFRTGHRWTGWDGQNLTFETGEGAFAASFDATVLALGGGSWPRLGSDGAWTGILRATGIETSELKPSNCGFVTNWQEHVGSRFAGTPLKGIAIAFAGETALGEAMITTNGIEGGAIYALSGVLRDEIDRSGSAVASIDLRPGVSEADLAEKIHRTRTGDSLSSRLRKAGLTPAAISVLREGASPLPKDAERLAAAIKAAPLVLHAPTGLDRAISTAGGIRTKALDENLMLRDRPGTFAAGEMLDWEAPTGGYLLQGCFATGRQAAIGALRWMGDPTPLA